MEVLGDLVSNWKNPDGAEVEQWRRKGLFSSSWRSEKLESGTISEVEGLESEVEVWDGTFT